MIWMVSVVALIRRSCAATLAARVSSLDMLHRVLARVNDIERIEPAQSGATTTGLVKTESNAIPGSGSEIGLLVPVRSLDKETELIRLAVNGDWSLVAINKRNNLCVRNNNPSGVHLPGSGGRWTCGKDVSRGTLGGIYREKRRESVLEDAHAVVTTFLGDGP